MVLALVADVAASFEEEGVPVTVELVEGDAVALGRRAARAAASGIGIGGDGTRLVVTLAAASGTPYISAPAREARRLGTCAARLVRRVPLPFSVT